MRHNVPENELFQVYVTSFSGTWGAGGGGRRWGKEEEEEGRGGEGGVV